MRFQRLKLTGFKSFVEATELRIEPGLTGIVGPNGCGKSNLLEALRWVMGANSAKAMRGEGMDDVIFGGTGARPARSHAEVALQIDNAERRAPERFNDAAVIEVVRRIQRGGGSTYRVNGVEARARDVQLLFADASTGANSPALVRQGQISELIAAKPSNRRRILEEAAGVSGLHARRHEATLRLNAAEANLARLGDLAGEIEGGLGRLKREARKAEAYKRLSADIRALEAAAWHARWAEAANAATAAEAALAEASARAADAARLSEDAETEAARSAEALRPLREEEMVATAVLQQLTTERERLSREAALAQAEIDRLRSEAKRNDEDAAREDRALADASSMLDRLQRELAQLDRTLDNAPERLPELERRVAELAIRRAEADAALEALAAQAAAQTARRQAALDRTTQARLIAKSAALRRDGAGDRMKRLSMALEQADREAAALIGVDDAEVDRGRTVLQRALETLAAAREALAQAEREREDAARAEAQARTLSRQAEDELGRVKAEAQGLAQLAASTNGKTAYPPVLDRVGVPAGLERAVAAAFGEALEAALDSRAPSFWRAQADRTPHAWPAEVRSLADLVQAPPALTARLQRTGLVARVEGARLQAELAPGEALVSAEGDLWRWDGFVATAEAPRPAARRLAQRARLLEIEQRLVRLAPTADAAQAAYRTAGERLRAAEQALAAARRAPAAAERAVGDAREAVERHARAAARHEARAQALGEAAARYRPELQEAQNAHRVAEDEAQQAAAALATAELETASTPSADAAGVTADARRAAAQAREAEGGARAELDAERRAQEGRLRRREALVRDEAGWRRRAEAAAARTAALEAERARLVDALTAATAAPLALEAQTERLADELTTAGARRDRSARALIDGEACAAAAERHARAAESQTAAAREARAACVARLDAARDRLLATAQQLRDATGLEPQVLGERIAAGAVAIPTDPAGLETHLRNLQREREALGGVNLRADEEAAEQAQRLTGLRAEAADLAAAIATLRRSIESLNAEGRERLLAAFADIARNFRSLFEALFEGGQAELRLAESEDPLEAGLEIYACPPGKRLAVMSLMSGGEQALTAMALILGVFLANPAPVCVLDEVDAPLDDANVDRFCRLLDEMRRRTDTRFIAITHNPVTMSRMDRLYGVTMAERGVSRLVSVDLRQAERMVAA